MGRWRDDGGTVAGQWQDGGGAVAGRRLLPSAGSCCLQLSATCLVFTGKNKGEPRKIDTLDHRPSNGYLLPPPRSSLKTPSQQN